MAERTIRDLRTTDMSIHEFIASSFRSEDYVIISGHDEAYVASGLFVIDGFPVDTGHMKVPTVSIEHDISRDEPFQLGPGRTDSRIFLIDVFARSDGERDDLAEYVRYFLNSRIPIFDWNDVLANGVYTPIAYGHPDGVVVMSDRLDVKEPKLRHSMKVRFEINIDISSGYTLIT